MEETTTVTCGVGNQIKGNISKLSIIIINFDYYESETEAKGQSQ